MLAGGRASIASERPLAAERESPRWKSLTPELARAWEGQVRERRSEGDTLDWKELAARGRAAVRRLRAAGAPFLAGTDLGVAFAYPGTTLHEELAALVALAGLRPHEALCAATSNAARWLGWDDAGTVSEGKRADLVLLDADPLADIANVARIRGVVRAGRWIGPEGR